MHFQVNTITMPECKSNQLFTFGRWIYPKPRMLHLWIEPVTFCYPLPLKLQEHDVSKRSQMTYSWGYVKRQYILCVHSWGILEAGWYDYSGNVRGVIKGMWEQELRCYALIFHKRCYLWAQYGLTPSAWRWCRSSTKLIQTEWWR